MGKRIRGGPTPKPERLIDPGELVPDGLVTFSFKYFQRDHASFNLDGCEIAYFLSLLERLQALSGLTMQSLQNRKADPVIRFHPVDFRDSGVSADGFLIPRCEQFDDIAWQFSVTRNEHGRVHGFVVDTTFFVVWFDPWHRLYSS